MAARPHTIDGKQVDPKRAVPKDDKNRNESNVSTKRLYVSGIREEHTEQMLTDYFKKFGNVVKVGEFSCYLKDNKYRQKLQTGIPSKHFLR